MTVDRPMIAARDNSSSSLVACRGRLMLKGECLEGEAATLFRLRGSASREDVCNEFRASRTHGASTTPAESLSKQ